MSNEILLILIAIADVLIIWHAARKGPDRVFGTIVLNLVLANIFEAKFTVIYGLTLDVGNVFYACVFLATYFMLERYGKKIGLKTIWIGAGFMICFTVLSQLATRLTGVPTSGVVDESLITLFSPPIRITIASILAYVFAQYANITLFEWLRTKTNNRYVWFTSNGTNVVAQLIDSLIFFSIAFFDMPGDTLIQTILVGWLVKSVVVAIGSTTLSIDTYLQKNKT